MNCENLHHSKKDRHGLGEPCPVEARLQSGAVSGVYTAACRHCQASGTVSVTWYHGEDDEVTDESCPHCHGVGSFPVTPEEWLQAWEGDPILKAAQQLAWDELTERQREIYMDYARRTA
jgi:hypothetical protein